MRSQISIVKCKSYEPALVWEAAKKSVDLLGGIVAFIKPGSSVLVKPNLLMAKEPEFGITTHPELVRAVIKILKEINCKIYVGDGPSVWGGQLENVASVYERTGISKVCAQEDVNLVKFDKRRWRGKFPLTTRIDECDYLVSLPKFKTHDLTVLSGAIKNLFGLVSDLYKTQLHKSYFEHDDFASILVDIYQESRPVLTVVDGIVAMEGDGPATSGRLRNTGLVLASADCVALDSVLALIMGLAPEYVLTTREAAKRGLGVADINLIDILGERLEDSITTPFRLPGTAITKKIPRPIIKIARKLIRFYPKVDHGNCNLCGSCIGVCPNKVISIKSERLVFDYRKCISCFCCQEVCPNSAIKVKKSIFARAIGL